MRLIDADVLLEQMKRRRDYVGRASDAVCLVEDAPTIEAESVKRGKWSRNLIGSLTIQDGFLKTCFKCSECNGTNLVRSNFCPNCGARMEVEE